MPRSLIIRPSGQTEIAELTDLKAMQAVVGGCIEAIPLEDCTLWANEDGQSLDLPVNPVATRFAKRKLADLGRILLSQDGWILGTCFVNGPVDAEGDETDCPESVIAELHREPGQ